MSQSLNHHQATEAGCWCQRTFFTFCQSLYLKGVWVSRLFSCISLAPYWGDIMDTQAWENSLGLSRKFAWRDTSWCENRTHLQCLLSPFLQIFLEEVLPHLSKDNKVFKSKVQKPGQFLPSSPPRSSSKVSFQPSQSKKQASLFYSISSIEFSKRRDSK